MDRVKFTDKVYIKVRLKFVYTLSVNLTLSITVCQIPDAVDTVVCAPDDGW
jgi:hypothetical protein